MGSTRLAVCVRNDGCEASLELRKIYQLVDDVEADRHRQLRVIDESGEDYLYPEDFFVSIELPAAAKRRVLDAA